MKTGKTPYEIRSDLLHLAHQIVKDRKHAECVTEAQEKESTEILVTKSPNVSEVIAEAEKLNAFVSQSSSDGR